MDLGDLTGEILARCDTLAGFSEESGRLTRTFLRPPMRAVHDCLTAWMADADLQVRRDALGNLIGRRSAVKPGARVFVVGSHVDTVPNAGNYDGILGVLLGVAALKALGGRHFACAVDVIAFSEEEGVRYATPFLGSRAVCGCFDSGLLSKKDAEGVSLAQALRDFDLDPNDIAATAYPKGQVAGYLEAHIEQGPVLEQAGLSVGVVEAIAGQSRRWLRFTGKAGHAGTQPMETRHDALAGAAEFVALVEKTAKTTPGLRATVGSLVVEPGVVNVVPGAARLSLDVRHANDSVLQLALADLIASAQTIAVGRGLKLEVEMIMDQAVIPTDPAMTTRLVAAVARAGQTDFRLVSGAGHDAMIMATICPMTMLFVRSIGGISHHPDENVHHDDVRTALDVMIRFLEAELERTD
jgi:allantoate deiminase